MSRKVMLSEGELLPGMRNRATPDEFEERLKEATKLMAEYPELSVEALARRMGVTLNRMQWYCRVLKKRGITFKKVRVIEAVGETNGKRKAKSGK